MGRPGQTRDDNDDLDMEAAMTTQQECTCRGAKYNFHRQDCTNRKPPRTKDCPTCGAPAVQSVGSEWVSRWYKQWHPYPSGTMGPCPICSLPKTDTIHSSAEAATPSPDALREAQIDPLQIASDHLRATKPTMEPDPADPTKARQTAYCLWCSAHRPDEDARWPCETARLLVIAATPSPSSGLDVTRLTEALENEGHIYAATEARRIAAEYARLTEQEVDRKREA